MCCDPPHRSLRQAPSMRRLISIAAGRFRRAGVTGAGRPRTEAPKPALDAGPGASGCHKRLVSGQVCWLAYAPGADSAQTTHLSPSDPPRLSTRFRTQTFRTRPGGRRDHLIGAGATSCKVAGDSPHRTRQIPDGNSSTPSWALRYQRIFLNGHALRSGVGATLSGSSLALPNSTGCARRTPWPPADPSPRPVTPGPCPAMSRWGPGRSCFDENSCKEQSGGMEPPAPWPVFLRSPRGS